MVAKKETMRSVEGKRRAGLAEFRVSAQLLVQLLMVFFLSLVSTIATLNMAMHHQAQWNAVLHPATTTTTSISQLEAAIDLSMTLPSSHIVDKNNNATTTTTNREGAAQRHVHFSDYNQELDRLNGLIDRLHPPLNRSRPIQLDKKNTWCDHVPVPERHPTLTSSMEFVGCCGLGHRLARHAAAAHLSYALRIPLFSWWGCCGTQQVFAELFGVAPLELTPSFRRPANDPQHYQFRFDVVGPIFGQMRQPAHKVGIQCPIRPSKIDTDYLFYSTIRDRYTRKKDVDAFVQQHFRNKFSIAIHIRAGNGEKGDFEKKQRNVQDKKTFLRMVRAHIRNISKRSTKELVVFIATDTPSFVEDLRTALNNKAKVVDVPQVRKSDGEGVFFGEMQHVRQSGDDCMEGWHGAMMDALIASHADVMYAPKPSAFTETLPLSLVLGRPNRTVEASFCESKGWDMKCFKSVAEWSCETLSGKPTFFDALPQFSFL